MKKINSIDYGGKVMAIGILFGFIIPIAVYALQLTRLSGILSILSKFSFGIGMVILAGFSLWLMIELHQDKCLDTYYENQKNTKIDLGNGQYECQTCGNRKVKPNDLMCSICGTHFKEEITKKEITKK